MATDELEPVLGTTTNSTFCRRNWFHFHVLCYVVILFSSFATLFHFPFLRLKFDGKCPLYAVPVVQKGSAGRYKFISDDDNSEKTQWGSDANCNYCFFTPAFSFVISFVLCWFLCFCNTGSRLESNNMQVSVLSANQKWRILPPATICAMVMSIMTLVSSGIMSGGMNIFCSRLRNSVVKSCHDASKANWSDYPNLTGFYSNAAWAIAESWVSSSFWILLTLMSLLQCCEGPGEGYVKKARNSVVKGRNTALI